jgi:hypothetical protein
MEAISHLCFPSNPVQLAQLATVVSVAVLEHNMCGVDAPGVAAKVREFQVVIYV